MIDIAVNINLLPHQKKTVRYVIDELKGRAILADEVGMGKTIEAGMILKEYLELKMVKKFLILVPASLAFQWTKEMVDKLDIKDIMYNRKGRGWEYFDFQIASLDMAKREEHAQYLRKIDFDMVIVDEAHRLKNRKTLNWKFVNSLKKKYCLLLTATPIQNKLEELYNLISILHPDLYKDYGEFKNKYAAGKHLVKNADDLKNNLKTMMVRNSHADVKLDIPERNIHHIEVKLSLEERTLYEQLTAYVKDEYKKRKAHNLSILNLLTYQREICSSSFALMQTLSHKNINSPDLKKIYKLAKRIKINSKMIEVLKILKDIEGQCIIFTEYRATQSYIAKFLTENNYSVMIFNGGFSSSGKEWIKYFFKKNKKDILISTEAGSQGLNLQFCNNIINYDLPWNPMKVEQRIGRVHRLGQKRDVHIFNLATKNTIEDKILHLLYKKINLFKAIIGEMNEILFDNDKFSSLEDEIMEIIAGNASDKEIRKRFLELSEKLI